MEMFKKNRIKKYQYKQREKRKKMKEKKNTQKKEIKTKDLSEGNKKIKKNSFKESFTQIVCVHIYRYVFFLNLLTLISFPCFCFSYLINQLSFPLSFKIAKQNKSLLLCFFMDIIA